MSDENEVKKLNFSDDEDEKYISSEELIKCLSTIIQKIKDDEYNSITKQDIYDSLEEYITGVPKELDSDTVQYLFRGWWMTDIIRSINNPSYNRMELPSFSKCPFCFQHTLK